MSTLANRLVDARRKSGYSQEDLASAIGVTRGVIINLELPEGNERARKTPPQAIVINAICRELRINKEWLLNGTGEMASEYSEPEILKKLWQETSDFSSAEWDFLFKTIAAMKELNRSRSER